MARRNYTGSADMGYQQDANDSTKMITESKQDSRGIAPMVGDRESIEELTAGYDILDPQVAAAARSKLAELDVGLNTLQSQYDEMEEERTQAIYIVVISEPKTVTAKPLGK